MPNFYAMDERFTEIWDFLDAPVSESLISVTFAAGALPYTKGYLNNTHTLRASAVRDNSTRLLFQSIKSELVFGLCTIDSHEGILDTILVQGDDSFKRVCGIIN